MPEPQRAAAGPTSRWGIAALFAGVVALSGSLAAAAAGPPAMVAAANPAAVEAGLKVLRRGGTAADAAVAVEITLGLVEPQSSGLGGGGFLTYYDPKTRKVITYDGREMAPAGASRVLFLHADGSPMSYAEAVMSGRSAGTPSAVAMLYMAQREHGRLAWNSLFEDTAKLAEDGFLIGPRIVREMSGPFPQNSAPDVLAYFHRPDGSRLQPGDHLKNPAYARSLRLIAAQGPDAVLKGEIAQHIVDRLAQGPLPGTMTLDDLAAYKPLRKEALCAPYRQWTVCAPQPPSGGLATLEGLGILQRTDINKRGPTDPKAWYLLAQAQRLMYADDLRFIGDPAFVKVPTDGLLDPKYLDARAALIGPTAGPPPGPGHPKGEPNVGPDSTREPGGTSSFVIVDRWGHVAAMTATVESIFGDGRMVDGFFLNNQLTDFSFNPDNADGTPAANAPGPRKRPRSSMSPVIVLDARGRFVEAIGSPGGLAIPAYILKGIVGTLDWRLTMQQAVALPNLVAMGPNYIAEPAKFAPGVVEGLLSLGMPLKRSPFVEDSGLHGVVATPQGLQGGADPRREGTVSPCCN